MITDRLYDLLPPVHHVEHSGRQPGLRQQFRNSAGTQGNQLGRLQQHAIAECQRIRDCPVRHHAREIEWCNRCDDTDRIPVGAALHSSADLEYLTSDDLRQRAGEFCELDCFGELGLRLAPDFSVLLGDQRSKLVEMAFQEGPVAVENLHPLLDRSGRPCRESGRRRSRRRVYLLAR
jgi:hypothetical protein